VPGLRTSQIPEFLQFKVIEHMSRISVRLGERIRTLLKERLSGLPATEVSRTMHITVSVPVHVHGVLGPFSLYPVRKSLARV
jgi:hypothetical protein